VTTTPTLYEENHARYAAALITAQPTQRYLHATHALWRSLHGATMAQRATRLRSIAHLYSALGWMDGAHMRHGAARRLSRRVHAMKRQPTQDQLAQEATYRAQIAPGLAEVRRTLHTFFDAQEARIEAMRATVEPSRLAWYLDDYRLARVIAFNALALWVRQQARGQGGHPKRDAWGTLRDWLQSAIPGCGKRRIQAHHAQAWMEARLKVKP